MGEFYDGLEDLIDDMAEMMMGSEETLDFSTADTVSYQLPKAPCDFMAAVRTTMIDAGHIGVESGEGFYKYPNPAYLAPEFLK